MRTKEFTRRKKELVPVLAICYDFDKTLSPNDMQAQGYIQSVGYDVKSFWVESNGLAEENDMDQNLAYMYKMIEEAEGKLLFTQQTLMNYGSKVELFSGVEDWFERINEYGKQHDVIVEHYIISSGLKEMIEGTSIAKKNYFEKIYASSFYYDKKGLAKWPAQVVNYTNKTQFLFRIEKGVLDVNDAGVNDYFKQDEIRVPFRNMVYIGDSDTDIPCMKLVNTYGGHSIGVYNPDTNDRKKVHKMIRENRIKYFVPADYTENSKIDKLVKSIIKKTAFNEILENIYYDNRTEAYQEFSIPPIVENTIKKNALIDSLENSRSFATTHTVIADLIVFNNWTPEEKETLFEIAMKNHQIKWILEDSDLTDFYKMLLKDISVLSDNAQQVKEIIESHK